MKLSKLNELLKQEAITQEEYDEIAKTAEDDTTDGGGDQNDDGGGDADSSAGLTAEEVQRMIDRATNKLGNENKKLKADLDKARKANMSAEELRQAEIDEKEKELAEKEQALQDKESRMYAIAALKKAGLDDGSEDAMSLIDFVLGEDENTIDSRVKALKVFADRIAKNTTDGIYRENGREPGKGNAGGGKGNPWSKDSWNLTEQMKLEVSNPELAKSYKAAAGH